MEQSFLTPLTWSESSSDENCLHAFLLVVAQVDAVLQNFYRRRQQEDSATAMDDEIFSLNNRDPNLPAWASQHTNWANEIPQMCNDSSNPLGRLAESFSLNDFELCVLILGCLTRFEERYSSLFSTLQLSRQSQPTLELALMLFCPGQFERNVQRASLLPDAPLLRHGLIRLNTPRNGGSGERTYQASEMVYLYLLGYESLPESMRWIAPSRDEGNDDFRGSRCTLPPLLPALLELRCDAGVNAPESAAEVAQQYGLRALALDLSIVWNDGKSSRQFLVQALSVARLYGAMLVLTGISWSPPEEKTEREKWAALMALLTEHLQSHPLPVCCPLPTAATEMPLPKLVRAQIYIALPKAVQRAEQLQNMLDERERHILPVNALVQSIALDENEMARALAEARIASQQHGRGQLTSADLYQAFLHRARQNFNHLAQRVTPVRTMGDLVISEELGEQLQEILCAIRMRDDVLRRGFSRKLGQATGISALFHGDPGTGKTLVAEVLAGELGVDLIRVDLSTVVNKYIGETEKNLARIFDLAAQDAGVLFFDEADALFGKRSETKDAKDRHANIEIAYLLQRLESHPGLVVLATNNRSHLDDAFTRRFTFITRFSYPDASLREKMWRAIWPPGMALSKDVDFTRLAQTQLTGANIRNTALLASWLAEGGEIKSTHIERAIKRELGKMGRAIL